MTLFKFVVVNCFKMALIVTLHSAIKTTHTNTMLLKVVVHKKLRYAAQSSL